MTLRRQYRDLTERLIVNSILSEDTHYNGEPCWIWLGHRRPNGYGTLNVRRDGQHKVLSAHRTAYEDLVGPIPEGMTLDHKCAVRECINPNHLEPVLHQENCARRNERRRA